MLLAILAFIIVSVSHFTFAVAVALLKLLEHTDGIGVVNVLIMLGECVRIEEDLRAHFAIVRIIRGSSTFAGISRALVAHLLVELEIVRFLLHDDIGRLVIFPFRTDVHSIFENG